MEDCRIRDISRCRLVDRCTKPDKGGEGPVFIVNSISGFEVGCPHGMRGE